MAAAAMADGARSAAGLSGADAVLLPPSHTASFLFQRASDPPDADAAA